MAAKGNSNLESTSYRWPVRDVLVMLFLAAAAAGISAALNAPLAGVIFASEF